MGGWGKSVLFKVFTDNKMYQIQSKISFNADEYQKTFFQWGIGVWTIGNDGVKYDISRKLILILCCYKYWVKLLLS